MLLDVCQLLDEFLHGTNGAVGRFQIDGTVERNNDGEAIYNLTYTWNDIIDPNFKHMDDEERNAIAQKHFKPKDYILRIKWSDQTIIKAKRGGGGERMGWLKNWSTDWVEKLEKIDKDYYNAIEREQARDGELSWTELLAVIKDQYKDYYN